MHIRLATPADLPGIVDIYNASIAGRQATADLAPVTVDSKQAWFDKYTPERRPMWVAETTEEGDLLGWLGLSDFYSEKPAYHATAEVSLYVASQAQGQGVGKALLSHLFSQQKTLGLTSLTAVIFEHNAVSLRLFEKFGFTLWGRFPHIADLDGKPATVVVLGWQQCPQSEQPSLTHLGKRQGV